MAQHTSGTWSVQPGFTPHTIAIIANAGGVRDFVGSVPGTAVNATAMANAQIISAAPCMLAALRQIKACIGTGDVVLRDAAIGFTIDTVIAAAEGR